MTPAGMAQAVHATPPMQVSRHRLGILSRQISRSLTDPTTPHDPHLRVSTAVRASLEAFVACSGQVNAAAAEVAPLMHDLGAREARRRSTAARLDSAFQLAGMAVQRGLPHLMGENMSSTRLLPLRQGLMAYLTQLHHIARAGFDHASYLMGLTEPEKVHALSAIVFAGAPPQDLLRLCTMTGFDPERVLIPLASVHTELPSSIRDHPEVLTDSSLSEALIPQEWCRGTLGRRLISQAVVGPPTTMATAHESIMLTRNAAALLRDGTASDHRAIVPATDLLGEILVRGNRLIATLLIDKHLQALATLPANRRLILAETLLLVLERGRSLSHVARETNIAAQTVHNRMRALRELLGDRLDDPDQRLELIVALRAALDVWRTP